MAGIQIATMSTLNTPELPAIVLMIASCLIRAIYIVKLNDWVREHDPVGIAAGISCVNTVIAFVPWFIMQPATFAALPWSPTLVSVYFIYAYFIVGFATTVNVFA